jgi:hypothetical protein
MIYTYPQIASRQALPMLRNIKKETSYYGLKLVKTHYSLTDQFAIVVCSRNDGDLDDSNRFSTHYFDIKTSELLSGIYLLDRDNAEANAAERFSERKQQLQRMAS